MNASLTLFYSRNVYLNLIENVPIETIDKITTEYENQEEILGSDTFIDQVNAFYIYTTNYRKKIKKPEDRKGKLCIIYFEHHNTLQTLRILYKKDKIKQNPKKMVNSISKELKDTNNSQIILELLKRFNFIFESEHNLIYYKLNRLKNSLRYTTIPSEQQKKAYNRLLKIIKEELNKGYDPSSNQTTSLSYYHIRIVDEFLETTQNIKTLPKNKKSLIPPEKDTSETNPPKNLVKKKNPTCRIGDPSWKN